MNVKGIEIEQLYKSVLNTGIDSKDALITSITHEHQIECNILIYTQTK